MRPEKQLLLDEIREQIENRPTFFIMKYSGFTANAATDFRRQIAEIGGAVEMVRKRLLIKAARELEIALDHQQLPGHISLVFAGEDPIQAAKTLFRFQKDTERAVEVVGGRVDGALYPAEDIEKLSKLPGKEGMRAQLLGTLEAPLSQTLAVVNTLLCSVIYCLENKRSEVTQ